jgi:hypothetical protein
LADTSFDIDLTTTEEPIVLEVPADEQRTLEVTTGQINIYEGFGDTYSYTLSQVDIDNAFIIVSELSIVANKQKILIIIENVGIALEYGIDYSIIESSKITWDGYELESKLQIGDKIKIYY